MTDIEWEKIEQKPEKEYKVPGEYLLDQRSTIETKDQEIAEKNLTIKHLEEQLKNSQDEAETRGNKVKEMIEKYGEMNVKFEEINARLEEVNNENKALKQQIQEFEDEKQKIEDRLNTLIANEELQEELIKGKDEDLMRLSEELEQLKMQLKSAADPTELEELKKKYEDYPSPEELEELRKRPDPDQVDNMLIGKDEEIEKISSELKKLKSIHENLSQNFENIMEENEKLKSEMGELGKQPVSKPIAKPPIVTSPTHIAPKTIEDIKPPVPEQTVTTKVQTPGPKFSIADETKTTFAYSSTESEVTKKRDLPEVVLNIFENMKIAIQGGIRAGELCKLLEDSRDEIANKIGFSSALKAMGDVARKLRKAPQNAQIDNESVMVFLQKIDEWKHTMEGG